MGWVGLGKMGRPMAARLVSAGHEVTAHRRRPETPALEGAAAMEEELARLAAASGILISMISDDAALEAVADAVIPAMTRGALYIDMSTVSPAASARVAGKAEAKGVDYLRAPVVGSTDVAASGELLILASGPEEALRRAEPLFAHLGRRTVYLGPGEEARHMKLALSLMV
ncbi:MAG: NAD(P)-dependent oxidoreductase, partial [Alphaproteobacteria bacterium]